MKRAAALCAFLVFAVAAPAASGAEFGIVPGSVQFKLLDAEGHPEERAGSHPDRVQIDLALDVEGTGTTLRDLAIELPPGFGGNPSAVPECPPEVYEKDVEECPAESQIGAVGLGFVSSAPVHLPVFQPQPVPGKKVTSGSIGGQELPFGMELRPDDLGITFKGADLPEVALTEMHFELWGVPVDHQEGTAIPRRPFFTAPTRCGPLPLTVRVRSWQPEAPWLSASAETAPLHGCESLGFEPRLGFQLSNPLADSPTGQRMELNLRQNEDPDGLANAQLKEVTISMPEGIGVSLSGATDFAACGDAEFGLGTSSEPRCPPSSKVGTVEFATPSLNEPLRGSVYVGQEHPGERLRTLTAVSGQGFVTKFAGSMQADPATGRLSTTLRGLPQTPIERVSFDFDGGPGALLATPLACGTYVASSRFVPYGDGAPVDSLAPVTIAAAAGGGRCPNPVPFSPKLLVSSSSHAAGKPTAVSITLQRQPGEQLPKRFALSLPAGLSGTVGNAELCPSSAIASGACPSASRVGSAEIGVGSGPTPTSLRGEVYLAGPYRGAPFSSVIVFHAAAGSLQLGTLAVRAAMRVKRTGQVTVETDSLPSLVEGVPIRIRTVGMTLDSTGGIRNPTSCSPLRFDAAVEASGGALANPTSTVPVKGCRKLGFRPRFSVTLHGRSQLRRHGRPQLSISTWFRRGDTGLRAMHLSLPSALRFSSAGLREICPRQDAVEGLCSAKASIGTVVARSLTSSKPLRGSIFIVQPKGDGPPEFWVSATAMGLRVSMRGRTSVRDGHFVTNLVGLPDTPLSFFSMRLRGGKRGTLSLAANPCAEGRRDELRSSVDIEGQNGAHRSLRLTAKAPCG